MKIKSRWLYICPNDRNDKVPSIWRREKVAHSLARYLIDKLDKITLGKLLILSRVLRGEPMIAYSKFNYRQNKENLYLGLSLKAEAEADF